MWKKKGLVFCVNGEFDWNKTHAQTPIADVLIDKIRIYYSTRNQDNHATISYIEVSKHNPSEILYIHKEPILDFGKLGTFDDSGLMPSSILEMNGIKYLYYIGWTTRGSVPYHNAIGLAVSYDGGVTFKRLFEGPIITTNKIEPYFSGTSFVVCDSGVYKIWYLSCIGWEIFDNKPEPIYNIKYAESEDGINWKQTGKVAIELKNDEGGLVSASVIKENGIYKMWFGKRKKHDYRTKVSNTYRIGYAESVDGINWIRKDEQAGIDISETGWDSQMISYPYLIKNDRDLLMFYNGNEFGKSGFGYAVWK